MTGLVGIPHAGDKRYDCILLPERIKAVNPLAAIAIELLEKSEGASINC